MLAGKAALDVDGGSAFHGRAAERIALGLGIFLFLLIEGAGALYGAAICAGAGIHLSAGEEHCSK